MNKVDTEFYKLIMECAEYINKISDRELKTQMSKELTKTFVIRHKESTMILFNDLKTLTVKGVHHG